MSFLIKNSRTFATLTFGITMTFVAVTGLWGQDTSSADGAKIFAARCSVCHGADARGGEQAPPLAGNSDLQGKSIDWLRNVIHNGIPTGGMPAFNLPDRDLDAVAATVYSFNSRETTVPGDRAAGKDYFFGKGKC